MNRKVDLDDLIKKSLEESNNNPLNKEDIWNSIEEELFTDKNSKKGGSKLKKKSIGIVIGAAASLMLLYGGLQTEPVVAFVDKVKVIFEPEKEIVQQLEGTEEKTNVVIQEGTKQFGEVEYIIYIDEERYKMVKGDDFDFITTKEPLPERYPEVSMAIAHYPDKTVEELYTETKAMVIKDYPEVLVDEDVTTPQVGKHLLVKKEGYEWNTEETQLYFIENTQGGSFLIQQKFFLEASEGHGARFNHMLKEFRIVPNEE